jgi:hypothetical protein
MQENESAASRAVDNLNPLSGCIRLAGKTMSFGIDLPFNFDIAAKRRKKHKNQTSGLVISMC